MLPHRAHPGAGSPRSEDHVRGDHLHPYRRRAVHPPVAIFANGRHLTTVALSPGGFRDFITGYLIPRDIAGSISRTPGPGAAAAVATPAQLPTEVRPCTTVGDRIAGCYRAFSA